MEIDGRFHHEPVGVHGVVTAASESEMQTGQRLPDFPSVPAQHSAQARALAFDAEAGHLRICSMAFVTGSDSHTDLI